MTISTRLNGYRFVYDIWNTTLKSKFNKHSEIVLNISLF